MYGLGIVIFKVYHSFYIKNELEKSSKKFAKKVKDDDITDWRKLIRWGKTINKFRDIYDVIRTILIDNGMPEDCMVE